MILPNQTYNALLSSWPVARLATLSPAVQPHCVPIVFCEHNGIIYSPIDGKRKTSSHLKRFTNLANNPKATLLLDDYTEDWQNLWWVRIDGQAELIEVAADEGASIAQRLLDKYPQYRDPALMFGASAFLGFKASKVTAWAQSNSLATIRNAITQRQQS